MIKECHHCHSLNNGDLNLQKNYRCMVLIRIYWVWWYKINKLNCIVKRLSDWSRSISCQVHKCRISWNNCKDSCWWSNNRLFHKDCRSVDIQLRFQHFNTKEVVTYQHRPNYHRQNNNYKNNVRLIDNYKNRSNKNNVKYSLKRV